MHRRTDRSILTIAFAVSALGARAEAINIVVPDDYASIQAAIDAASPGDTVLVEPGIYVETIHFRGKDIVVRSTAGAQNTVIDGAQQGTVVIFEEGESRAAILHGFTITGGLGSVRPPGGIWCGDASPTIRQCVIEGNQGSGIDGGAGGVQLGFSSAELRNCTLRANTGGHDTGDYANGAGGMICRWDSSPSIQQCLFEANVGAAGAPGAFKAEFGADPIVNNCVFLANEGGGVASCSARGGPGAAHSEQSDATFRACLFEGNSGGRGSRGAGALRINAGNTLVVDCTFVDNVGGSCPDADPGGAGAIDCGSPTIRIYTSEFRGNQGGRRAGAGAIRTSGNCAPEMRDCAFIENRGGDLDSGGPGALDYTGLGLPDILRCTFVDNVGGDGSALGGPGAVRCTRAGLFEDCVFEGNQGGGASRGRGGPGVLRTEIWATICVDACRLVQNVGGAGANDTDSDPDAGHGGAGAMHLDGTSIAIVGCTVVGNEGASSASYSAGPGAFECTDGDVKVASCTVAGNRAGSGPGVVEPDGLRARSGADVVLVNSIFWNDSGSGELAGPREASHSLVRGGTPGSGNLDADPRFVDLAGGDVHLRCASPCRDAGDTLDPDVPDTDVDDGPRVVGPALDIGADEYDAPAAGTNYCVSMPNSTGTAALIDARGCNSVADGILPLAAGPVPDTFGAFFYGVAQVQVPFGNGFRCVGGASYRLAFEPIAGGELRDELDYASPPQPSGAITAGSTWHFQAWFRDPAAGGAQFDLSDGLQVSFAP